MNFLTAFLVILFVSLSGYGLVRLVLRDQDPFSFWGRGALGFVAGFGLLGTWGNLVMLARGRLSFWLLALPLLPLAGFGLTAVIESAKRFRPGWRVSIKKPGWHELIFIAIVLFGAGAVFLLSVTFPLHFWDSRAIWGTKAKLLYDGGTIFSDNFLDPNRIQPHFRYPLLYPLAQSFIYLALGQTDDWAVMILIGLFFPLLIFLLFDLLRLSEGSRSKALLGAATLAVLPLYFMIDGPAFSGYADVPLALFFLASFSCFYLWQVKGDHKLFILGAILSGFLPLVKNEGALLLLMNLFWLVWPKEFKDWRGQLKRLLLFLLVIGVIIGPWLWLRSYIPDVQDERYAAHLKLNEVIGNIPRIPGIANFYLQAFLGTQPDMMGHKFLWGGLWVLFSLAGIKSIRENRLPDIKLFCLVILFCCAMGAPFLIGPAAGGKFDPGGMVSSFFRVMMPITPLVIILVVRQADLSWLPVWPGPIERAGKRKKK